MATIQNKPSSRLLDLALELQVLCFSALGEVDGNLGDAFRMAMTCKALAVVYKEFELRISRYIIEYSEVYTYDVLLYRVRGEVWNPDILPNLDAYMPSHTLTISDIRKIRSNYRQFRGLRDLYVGLMPEYRNSPFPYIFSDDPSRETLVDTVAMKRRAGNTPETSFDPRSLSLPTSFKSRFYKGMVRYIVSERITSLSKSRLGRNSKFYEWLHKISHRHTHYAFLETLQALEIRDFMLGFLPYTDCDVRENNWAGQYGRYSKYPEFPDASLEVPDSLEGLLSSKGLSEDIKAALVQGWPRYRRNWPQTARFTVFGLEDSEEALVAVKGWIEGGSDVETGPLEGTPKIV